MLTFTEFLQESKDIKFDKSTMRWITIKDENNNSQRVLIKKKGGEVLAGMGGEHTGEKIKDVYKKENDSKKYSKIVDASKVEKNKKIIKKYDEEYEEQLKNCNKLRSKIQSVFDKLPEDKKNKFNDKRKDIENNIKILNNDKDTYQGFNSLINLLKSNNKYKSFDEWENHAIENASKKYKDEDNLADAVTKYATDYFNKHTKMFKEIEDFLTIIQK